MLLVLGDVLQVRHVGGIREERIELGADLAPIGLDRLDPGEVALVEKFVIAERRGPPKILVEPPDELPPELHESSAEEASRLVHGAAPWSAANLPGGNCSSKGKRRRFPSG